MTVEDTAVYVPGADSAEVRVSLAGDTTRIAGRFSQTNRGLQFKPAFPFDSGRDYEVVVGSSRTPFRLAAPERAPSTQVARVYPTSDTLPENLLRLYVEFSAPMSRGDALPHVKLLDERGTEVRDAFLPLDGDFWNRERTRYTLFLDPGRVKRDILPNRQMGRPLVARKRYSLVIDSSWRDGRGQPLVASYRKPFLATTADLDPIRLADWKIGVPHAGTREPLTIRFPKPLDHGLLQRAIGIQRGNAPLDGTLNIGMGERELSFTPASAWAAGDYAVLILDFLEDAAGNRVNRPFEVDNFERVDSAATPSSFTIAFRIR